MPFSGRRDFGQCLVSAFALLFAASAVAQTNQPAPAAPLGEVIDLSLSPDGDMISLARSSPQGGVLEIRSLAEGFPVLRLGRPAEQSWVNGAGWLEPGIATMEVFRTRDHRALDKQSPHFWVSFKPDPHQLFRVSVFDVARNTLATLSPDTGSAFASRNLAMVYSMPSGERGYALMFARHWPHPNERPRTALFKFNLKNGRSLATETFPEETWRVVLDNAGKAAYRMEVRTDAAGVVMEIFARQGRGWKSLRTARDAELDTLGVHGALPDGRLVIETPSEGAAGGVQALDPATGQAETLAPFALGEPIVVLAPASTRVAALYWVTPEGRQQRIFDPLLAQALPKAEAAMAAAGLATAVPTEWSDDGARILFPAAAGQGRFGYWLTDAASSSARLIALMEKEGDAD